MHQFMRRVGVSVAVVAITTTSGWLGVQRLWHVQLLSVQTNSMSPTFSRGDAVVVHKGVTLQLGSVVTYRSPKNLNMLISHRVVKLWPASHTLQTKGDALSSPDPAITSRLVMGQVVAVLPGLGRICGVLTSWPGLILAIYVPAAGIVWSELRRLERHFVRQRTYYAAL